MRVAVAGSSGLIGTQVVGLLTESGHDVVRLSRTDGVNLLQPDGLEKVLAGVGTVIDVTRSDAMGRDEATRFFTVVAENLGRAAAAAGVRRSVVLSIVGVDQGQDFDWYAATLAHENATREHAPGACVLRATQFHEFPGQILDRSRHGETAAIMDVPCQPVDSAEVARALAEVATATTAPDTDLAGPRVERLVELVRLLAEHHHRPVRVEPMTALPSLAGGSMLPGPGALTRGIDWRTWLARQPS